MKPSSAARLIAAAVVLVFLVFALVATSRAQTPNVAVAGTVKDFGGDIVPGSEVRARLYNCGDNAPKSGGVLVGAAKSKSFPVDTNTGAFSGLMFGNDQLTCGGIANTTDYIFGVYVNGKLVGPEQRYHLTGSSFNPGTQPSVNDDPPSGSNDYAIRNGDNTWHGFQDFTNATVDFTGATVTGIAGGPGGGAPSDASYITMKAELGLSGETPLASVNMRGPIASRPAADANKVGRLYCGNDSGSMRCTRDNGATWDDLLLSWNYIDGKPSTFAPSAHTHPESEVTNLVSDLAAKEATANKGAASGYAPLDGGATVPLANLPSLPESKITNLVSDLAGKQAALGFAPLNPANNLSDVANTATARGNLGAAASSHTHPESDVTNLTSDLATKFIKPLAACNNATTDKIITSADGLTAVCATDQTGVGGSGITTLNTLTATTQTMDVVNDTNVTAAWSQSSSSNHRLTLGFTGALAKARMHSATVYNDQANTFGAFLQKFRAGANFQLGDPTDFTKLAQFDLSAIATGQTRTVKLPDANAILCPNGSANGQICTWDNSAQQWVPGDPLVQGLTAHDAVGTSTNPVATGGYASAAAPTDVSADGDIVRAWFLRSGAQAVQLTHNGALYKPTTPSDTQPVSAASLPLPAGAATAANQTTIDTDIKAAQPRKMQDGSGNALASSTTTPAGTEQALIVRNIPSGTQTVNGAVTTTPPSNASTNVTQIGGTAVDTNSGNKSAGTIRVVIATDQPQLTSAFKVDGSAVTQPVSIAGTVTTQDTSTGATGSATPSRAQLLGGTDGTNLIAQYIDPCQGPAARSSVPISITANTQVITGQASKKVYICSINIGPIGTATSVALVEGSGTTCATSTAGIAGGATAATGWSFGANGGIVLGTGDKAVAWTATAANNVCLFVSAANQVSGVITYAIR